MVSTVGAVEVNVTVVKGGYRNFAVYSDNVGGHLAVSFEILHSV